MTAQPTTTNELIIKVNTMDDTVLKNIATSDNGLQTSNSNSSGLASYGLTTYGKNITASSPGGTVVGSNSKAINGYSNVSAVTSVGFGCQISGHGITHIGCGGVNSTPGTFSVSVSIDGQQANIHTYIMMDVDGKIPGERMSLQAAGAPTTSTVGTVGQFYVDTTNQDAYICVSDASSTYTWKKITP